MEATAQQPILRVLSLLLGQDASAQLRAKLFLVFALLVVKTKSVAVLSDTAGRRLAAWGTPAFQSAAMAHLFATLALSPLDALSQASQRWALIDMSHDLATRLAKHTVAMPAAVDAGLVAEGADKFVGLALKQAIEIGEGLAHLFLFTRVLAASSPSLARWAVVISFAGSALAMRLGGDLPELFRVERTSLDAVNEHLSRCRDHQESINFYGGRDREVRRAAELDALKLAAEDARKARKDQVELLSQLVRRVFGEGFLPSLLLSRPSALPTIRPSPAHGHSHVNSSSGGGRNHHHHHDDDDDDDDNAGHGKHHKTGEDFAQLNRVSVGFDEMLLHLGIVAENYNDFTRLHSLATDVCAALDYQQRKGDILVSPLGAEDNAWLRLENLSVTTPDGQTTLISGLNLTLERGQSLLVAGPSGCGKTALCRVLCGIWSSGAGNLLAPPRVDIFFLPQRAYCPLDTTLREQVLYPNRVQTDDAAVVAALEAVGLAPVMARLGAGLDTRLHSWSDVLSMGEVQRLSFARLVIARPHFAVLDEATSGCDVLTEQRLYRIVEATCTGGFLSVGHRPSIESFHLRKLALRGPSEAGSWALEF